MWKNISNSFQSFWQKLQPRERFLVTLAAVTVTGMVFVQVGIIGNLEKIQSAIKDIERATDSLAELVPLHEKWQALRDKKLQTQGSNQQSEVQSLLAIVENKIQNVGIKTNVRYMRPSTVPIEGKLQKRSVEVKIENITSASGMKFLYDVEQATEDLFVEYFYLRDTMNKPGYYDFTVRVSTIIKL